VSVHSTTDGQSNRQMRHVERQLTYIYNLIQSIKHSLPAVVQSTIEG